MATKNSTNVSTASVGKILQGAGVGVAPEFSTATYPSVGTGTGTILRADGTNWSPTTSTYPSTNAVSTLLYASAANVMSALATANNGLLVTDNTGIPSILSGPGSPGKVLQSNTSTPPSYSTATYPSVATGTGTILRADGTNWSATTSTYPNTNAINTLLYASAANVMSALATANNGVLITSAGGVPSYLGAGTTGQVLTATTGSPPSWGPAASGTVTNVLGTTNRTTSSGGATPTIDISAAYVGQTSITTLGTIATGVWSGTTIAINKGGTNATSFATNTGLVKYDGTSLVTSSTAKLDSSNRYTNTAQPIFWAYLNTSLTNATGDSTVLNPLIFDTTTINVGTSYNTTTGIFTAPIAGTYLFQTQVVFNNLGAAHTSGYLKLTSTFDLINEFNPGVARSVASSGVIGNCYVAQSTQIVTMAAAATFKILVVVGNSTKTVGIQGNGGSGLYTSFCGYLVC